MTSIHKLANKSNYIGVPINKVRKPILAYDSNKSNNEFNKGETGSPLESPTEHTKED